MQTRGLDTLPRAVLGIALLAAAATVSVTARSEPWGVARHDARRTGFSAGCSDIDRPAVQWRYFLGSAFSAASYLTADIDGDELDEVVVAAGGNIAARSPNGITFWKTRAVPNVQLSGILDLNGDGNLDIVAWSNAPSYVAVLLASDGSVQWVIPDGVIGKAARVMLADLDSDGLLDLYVAENRWDTINSHQVGIAYSFASGFGDPAELWRLAWLDGEGGGAGGDTIGDFDGDGAPELLFAGYERLIGIDGATGFQLYELRESLGPFIGGMAYGEHADVDLDGREELFLFEDEVLSAGRGKRWAARFDYDPATEQLVLTWSREVFDPVADRHRFHANSLSDVNGDGTPDVVTSFYDGASDVWRIEVLSVDTGAVTDSVHRASLAGVADLDGDGVPEIMADEEGVLAGYSFRAGLLERRWELPGFELVNVVDRQRARTRRSQPVTATWDLDGDGAAELLVRTIPGTGAPAETLRAVSLAGGWPVAIADATLPAGVSFSAFHISHGVTAPETQLMALRSDGPLVVFDRELDMSNFSDDPADPRSTLRAGGYYSGMTLLGHTPVVGVPGPHGEAPPILVRDSRGAMVAIDPSGASIVEAPAILWEENRGYFPAFCDTDADGSVEVVYWTRTTTLPQRDAVAAREVESGALLWSTPVSDETTVARNDLLCADVDREPGDDVFFQLMTSAFVEEAGVLNGFAGALVWPAHYSRAIAQSASFGKALADANDDGVLDLVGSFGTAQIVSGADGALIVENPTIANYYFPLVVEDPESGEEQVLLHGGHGPNRLLRLSDLSVIWTDEPGPFTGAFGTVVPCGDGRQLFVAGTFQSPHLRMVHVETGALESEVWLGGGGLYFSEAALDASGASQGMLGTVSGAEDLTGDGTTNAALVGSTDGFLYAVDPCEAALVWSIDMGAPVGEPVIADTDGDSVNEVLVTVADGYLYQIGDEVTPAPDYVWDTDPPAGFPDEDRDAIETFDTLYASWGPVAGVTGYEYVVVGPGEEILTPGYVTVVGVTRATQSGLPLEVGQVYYFAVRAVGTAGRSSETLSDGIEVVDRADGDADGDGDADFDADEVAEQDRDGDLDGDREDDEDGTRWQARGGGCGCSSAGERGPTRGAWLCVIGRALRVVGP